MFHYLAAETQKDQFPLQEIKYGIKKEEDSRDDIFNNEYDNGCSENHL